MKRRLFLQSAAALALATPVRAGERFEVTRTDAEWRAMLSDLEYRVMRREGTERAFTSPLNDEERKGVFHCKGCDLALYASETKYDSGTGWPSFYEALPDAVATRPDRKLLFVRTEVHCRRCGSHLGHIFDDGPPPTGKRHCINGVSLVFKPANSA
ncbi:peptide-methionine (R)-S-oxide reductase [Rhodovulum iodosum]|uniref:peptide-methionine (R)-S-oxide reductase n=1 Tax=Rhodovulum iodosum TaxID=68291 RepID=A0ABV3XNX0_9RHOB|nr:peptide-methionine (R)-S-oxide reductase MsrB [Rhodovulum robiginosum]RSK37961.1 peptide-methionine (R)-S-oxide reductase [Rhodovulum robiginosum]